MFAIIKASGDIYELLSLSVSNCGAHSSVEVKVFLMNYSLWCLLLFNLCSVLAQNNTDEEEAKEFLATYDAEYGKLLNLATVASWNYETNITSENAELSSAAWLALDLYQAEAVEEASQFHSSEFSEDTRRQLSKVGSRALPDSEMTELKSLIDLLQPGADRDHCPVHQLLTGLTGGG